MSFREKPQITNIWDFKKCDSRFGSSYPGRIPGQIVWNLMYYFTQEKDVFVDPMAGSGTSIDVGKVLRREVIAFDLDPSREDIAQNDITTGIPLEDEAADFVFLDPPYWNMKRGEYTEKESDLSMLTLNSFYTGMEGVFDVCHKILKPRGYIGLLISSKKSGQNKSIDLAFNCYKMMIEVFNPIERIVVPYYNATSTESRNWRPLCEKNKFMLRAFRDLIIMQKDKNP